MLDQFVCICTNILDLNGDHLAYGYHGNLSNNIYLYNMSILTHFLIFSLVPFKLACVTS
jgi:hypothetical protein